MIKIITIVGARPQIIKAAALSRAVKNFSDALEEVIIHTGQHYDENMSQVFFDELNISKPHYNLNIRAVSHGEQTAEMVKAIEKILLEEKPQAVIIYGDTNSTLAGALAASKIHIPVLHIEAGLRSFDKHMPEEINRVVTDHISTMLFCPTQTAYNNLLNEGFKQSQPPYTLNNPKVYYCGDIMYDNSLYFSELAKKKSTILTRTGVDDSEFVLATIHRSKNTDEVVRLQSIFDALIEIAQKIKVVIPLHPRTLNKIRQLKDLYQRILNTKQLLLLPPVSFLEMINFENNARMIITDSGGVQKEAYFFKKPCIILRSETEWIELLQNGASRLADADKEKIIETFNDFINLKELDFPALFGNGNTAEFICNEIIANFKNATYIHA